MKVVTNKPLLKSDFSPLEFTIVSIGVIFLKTNIGSGKIYFSRTRLKKNEAKFFKNKMLRTVYERILERRAGSEAIQNIKLYSLKRTGPSA